MTKTYLGYGYTNNRGVAKLEYTPNNEKLTTTGYKNTHTNNTQITAQITHKNKTYTSNTKQYNGITLPTILYYNDGTNTTDFNLPNGVTCTTNGEYLTFNNCANKEITLPIQLQGDCEFSIDILSTTVFGLYMGNQVVDNMRFIEAMGITYVYREGTLTKTTKYDSVTVPFNNVPDNYYIKIIPEDNSFSIKNIQIKRLEE